MKHSESFEIDYCQFIYHRFIITAGSTSARRGMWLKNAIFNQTLKCPSPIAYASFPVLTGCSATHSFKLTGCVPVVFHANASPPASYTEKKNLQILQLM